MSVFFALQIMLFLQLATIETPKRHDYTYPAGPITQAEYEFAQKVRGLK